MSSSAASDERPSSDIRAVRRDLSAPTTLKVSVSRQTQLRLHAEKVLEHRSISETVETALGDYYARKDARRAQFAAMAEGASGAGCAAVLVVDDEPEFLEAVRSLLSQRVPGVTVRTAGSAREALAMLEVETFALLITDYRMAGMDGLAFLGAARALAPLARRVLISANADLRVAAEAVNELGVQHLLPKPFDADDLVRVVVDAVASGVPSQSP